MKQHTKKIVDKKNNKKKDFKMYEEEIKKLNILRERIINLRGYL